MRKLIVGCGYLGRRVAARWLAQGDEVQAVTRSTEHADHLRELGIRPIVGDVLQPETLRALPDCDTLLYAVGRDRNSGHSQHEVYVDGLNNVLQSLNGRVGRLIYISSTSVYGQNQGEWVDEDSPCQPTSSNGQVCLAAEQTVWKYFSQGQPAVATPSNSATGPDGRVTDSRMPGGRVTSGIAHILRLAGLYGPQRLIARIASLKAGTPLTGEPSAWLNLIHVEDAAAAVVACEARVTSRSTYVVADDLPIERQAYYAAVARLVGAPEPRFEERGVGETPALNKRCRNARVREELGLSLQFPDIHAGLIDAVRDENV